MGAERGVGRVGVGILAGVVLLFGGVAAEAMYYSCFAFDPAMIQPDQRKPEGPKAARASDAASQRRPKASVAGKKGLVRESEASKAPRLSFKSLEGVVKPDRR